MVNYLTGDQPARGGRRADQPTTVQAVGPGAYYAQQAGRWHGQGATAMIGADRLTSVDPVMLHGVLLGQHPTTGQQLVAAVGSAGRTIHDNTATIAPTGRPSEQLTIEQAAKRIDVDPSYLRSAQRAALRLRAQSKLPDPVGSKGTTFTDAIKAWFDAGCPNVAPHPTGTATHQAA